ncbi:hypothetical protein MMC20_002617 [Loxospora ochrophaea]|nr:hypothetical protein [Loxospora ochrophaea]
MAATAPSLSRKPTSQTRPGLSHIQQASGAPQSPHTPQKPVSSTFSSPSVSYRAEEDNIVFEFGTRYIRAGFAGENSPRCTLGFGSEESIRVGDYRRWLPGFESRPRKKRRSNEWSHGHELWRMDLREVDLGLVEDRIERAVREAYTKYLLLDAKSRRLLLILPPVLPHPLLSVVLSTLFNNSQTPSITLLSSPTLNVVAAGLRSGVVVDVGWNETVITGVFEFREVHQRRTTRAMRLVTLEMGRLLSRQVTQANGKQSLQQRQKSDKDFDDEHLEVEFEHAEEVTVRMAWCRSYSERNVPLAGLKDLQVTSDEASLAQPNSQSSDQDSLISIPLVSSTSQTTQIPFQSLSYPVESALLAKNANIYDVDEDEQPIHRLLYDALSSLPPDVRGICMSRVIITGGGSNIPGLRSRLLDEVSALVRDQGWNPIRGKVVKERHQTLKKANNRHPPSFRYPEEVQRHAEKDSDQSHDVSAPQSAAFEPQIADPIEEKLHPKEVNGVNPAISGVVRGTETLGAWVGGSLVAGLKIKGVVEIDRELFLQHGFAGARRDTDLSVLPQRHSFGPGIPRTGPADKAGWTLGGWA